MQMILEGKKHVINTFLRRILEKVVGKENQEASSFGGRECQGGKFRETLAQASELIVHFRDFLKDP